MDEIDGMSASTHSLPLSMYARYLSAELGCEVALLGIQSVSVEMGDEVSPAVQGAIKAVTDGLCKLLFTK